MLYLLWLLVLCCAVRGQEVEDWTDRDFGNSTVAEQNERYTSIFDVIRSKNIQCSGITEQQGTCYSRRECSTVQGTASGSCARNWGVCCVIHRYCDSSTKFNGTYFTNPGYPGLYNDRDSAHCTITVSKSNPNVCQLRVDFLDFTLSQPDPDGNCVDDNFAVTGGSFPVPPICGDNANQHVYVDFPAGSTSIQLAIRINTLLSTTRKWNIKLTQIECNSREQVPPGLLMYYRELEGSVKSFNYDPIGRNYGTRQLAGMNYGVGVRAAPGYCSIEWRQASDDPYSFTVSGDTGGVQPGDPGVAEKGDSCNTDFVVIPKPFQNQQPRTTDRFCGNALLPTTTYSKPFILTVVTDKDDHVDVDLENRGFSLTYRQLPC